MIDLDNILFGSEMLGAVRGIDPETGHYFDDTPAATSTRSVFRRRKKDQVYSGNARRVFPRLDSLLNDRGPK